MSCSEVIVEETYLRLNVQSYVKSIHLRKYNYLSDLVTSEFKLINNSMPCSEVIVEVYQLLFRSNSRHIPITFS